MQNMEEATMKKGCFAVYAAVIMVASVTVFAGCWRSFGLAVEKKTITGYTDNLPSRLVIPKKS